MQWNNNNFGNEFQYNFFIVLGNGPAMIGISDCESLQLLSIKYFTVIVYEYEKQINEQTRQVQVT